jgi:hypothetical protein
MKTSKEKSAAKPKKTPVTKKTVKSKKASAGKSSPTEEEIREKAREIYYERIARGEHGSAESDWREAEEILRGL